MKITILRNHSQLGYDGLDLSQTHHDILHAPHLAVHVLDLGVSTTRVSSHTIIAQQVVGNNVDELSCEV